MNLILPFLILAAGIVLVAKGGDWFVDAASWIAKAKGIPSFIIGATIVSVATTLPEMIVSVMAAAGGQNEMAVGNAVGSVIANTAMFMSLGFIFMNVTIKRKEYIGHFSLLIGAALVLWLGCLGGKLSLWADIVLALIFVVNIYLNLKQGKEKARENKENNEHVVYTSKEMTNHIIMFVVGAACTVLGSRLLINGGTDIANILGVPERIIALTMVAIGTSVPELVTTITAIRKKEHSLSVGNIVGANIIDLALILPVSSIASRSLLPIDASSAMVDLPFCFGITLFALVPLLLKEKATRLQGILMLVAYGIYVASLIL